ncbi:MAG: hypothetical protein H6R26_1360 [Proteobacteria bacterium]|nr:hypothetical protein [Pseudomonadota bacterium]
MKRCSLLIFLLFMLSACLAPSVKPPAQQAGAIRTILVVAVEPPPLEVIPDLIETRLPVYRQNDTVPYDLFLERKLFRNPGGVLVAGLVSHNDVVSEVVPAAGATGTTLEPVAALGDHWTPTVVLAQAAAAQLTGGGVNAIADSRYFRLPLAAGDRTANLVHWQEAVRQWYNRDISPVNYASRGEGRVDAVVEVGIGTYRIFHEQAPLEVLVKLIDPASGRVVGRTRAEAFPVPGSAPTLLDRGAEKFKQVMADTGAQLVNQGLRELGLRAEKIHSAARVEIPNARSFLASIP